MKILSRLTAKMLPRLPNPKAQHPHLPKLSNQAGILRSIEAQIGKKV